MKRILLLSALWAFPFFTQAQDPEPDPFIYSEDWHSTRVFVDGVHYGRPTPNDEMISAMLYITKGEPDTLLATACNSLTATLNFVDDLNGVVSDVSLDTGDPCEIDQNSDYELQYFKFFQNIQDSESEFNIAISVPSDSESLGPVALTIYGQDGDWAEWTDYLLDVDQQELPTLSIYPNPVVDVISWNNLPIASYKASIYSVQGKLVQQETISANSLNVAALPSGLYFIELSDGNNVSRSKFIKR